MSNKPAILSKYDYLLTDDAETAAIVICERLRPVQGPRGVFFPPTYAGIGQGRKSDYHIDPFGPRAADPESAERDGLIVNRCTVDSVPSQANRLESRLVRYSGTYIPRVTISGSLVGERSLDLLEVGHRVGDAVVRYTADNGYEPFEKALHQYVRGNAAPLAQLAPTSLIFGHWDSRGETKSKARRLVRSEIVAFNVARVTKRSQYWSSIDPEVNEDLGQILKEAKELASRDPETKNPASQLGMTDVPPPESPGGVIAFGKIERTSMIAVSGLRSLAGFTAPTSSEGSKETTEQTKSEELTLTLRRYLFALSLAVLVDAGVWDLREGCILVRNGNPPTGDLREGVLPMMARQVLFNGNEERFTLPEPGDVEAYLEAAAEALFQPRLPEEKRLVFDPNLAKDAIDAKRGNKTTGPTNKQDYISRLTASPAWEGKEAELKKKKLPELKELWKACTGRTDAGEAGTGSEAAGS